MQVAFHYNLPLLQVHRHMIAHGCQNDHHSTHWINLVASTRCTLVCATPVHQFCTELETIQHICNLYKNAQNSTEITQLFVSILVSTNSSCLH